MVLLFGSAHAEPSLVYRVIPDTGKFEVHLKQCSESERKALYETLISKNITIKVSSEDMFMSIYGGEYRAADMSLVNDVNVYDTPRPSVQKRRSLPPYYGFWKTQTGTWTLVVKVHGENSDGIAIVEFNAIRYTGKTCFDRWKGLGAR